MHTFLGPSPRYVGHFRTSTVYFNVQENGLSGSQKYDVLSNLFYAINSNFTVFQTKGKKHSFHHEQNEDGGNCE